jgi:large conductance mechanosensitive channel
MLRNLASFLFSKQFLARASLFQLAAGLMIIYSLQHLFTALVGDVVLPIIGSLVGGLNFENSFLGLSRAVTATNLVDAKKQGAVLAYGDLLTMIINFVIIMLVLYPILREGAFVKKPENA